MPTLFDLLTTVLVTIACAATVAWLLLRRRAPSNSKAAVVSTTAAALQFAVAGEQSSAARNGAHENSSSVHASTATPAAHVEAKPTLDTASAGDNPEASAGAFDQSDAGMEYAHETRRDESPSATTPVAVPSPAAAAPTRPAYVAPDAEADLPTPTAASASAAVNVQPEPAVAPVLSGVDDADVPAAPQELSAPTNAAAAAAAVSSWVSTLACLPARTRIEVQRTITRDVSVQAAPEFTKPQPPRSTTYNAICGTGKGSSPTLTRILHHAHGVDADARHGGTTSTADGGGTAANAAERSPRITGEATPSNLLRGLLHDALSHALEGSDAFPDAVSRAAAIKQLLADADAARLPDCFRAMLASHLSRAMRSDLYAAQRDAMSADKGDARFPHLQKLMDGSLDHRATAAWSEAKRIGAATAAAQTPASGSVATVSGAALTSDSDSAVGDAAGTTSDSIDASVGGDDILAAALSELTS